jgi:exosortase
MGVLRNYRRDIAALGVFIIALTVAYGNVIRQLVHAWANDGNYTHGFVLAPIALLLVGRRWQILRHLPAEPSKLGLLLVVAALAQLIVGSIAVEFFLMRTSFILLLAGAVVFLFGWRHLSATGFSFALLLLSIPLPAIVLNQITFPLQMLASRVGVDLLQTIGVPALREGNVIVLTNAQLEVAEACSGLRSLVSLFSLGLLYAYFSHTYLWARIGMSMLTVPIAILTNALRVTGAGVATYLYGSAGVDSFFHTFSGWLMFVVSMAILMAAGTAFTRLAGHQQPLPS